MTQKVKGQITVFAALVFMLVTGLILTCLKSAVVYSYMTCAKQAAMISVENLMTHYHPVLKKYYGIMALDGGLGSSRLHLETLRVWAEDSFVHYMEGSALYGGSLELQADTPDILMLDDQEWAYMRREILLGWKDKIKEESFDGVLNLWNYAHHSISGDIREEEEKAELVYSQREEKEESEETQKGQEPIDPRDGLADLLKGGVLAAALPDGYVLSEKSADFSDVSYPVEKEGAWEASTDFKDVDEVQALFESLSENMDLSAVIQKGEQFAALYSYIPEVFSNGSMTWEGVSHERALSYEMEYLLNGSGSDRENLEAAVKKLIWLRMFLNMAYLLTHPKEDAKVRETAALIAGFLLLPEFQEVICILLKLAWAYTESLADCRTLLEGEKVSLLKKEGDWKISWESMLGLSADTLDQTENRGEGGMDYTGYLTLFLMLMSNETLMRRMTHLMEKNIRLTEGNGSFCMSNCIYGIRGSFDYSVGGIFRQNTAVSMTY